MIARLRSWYRARGRVVKILLATGAGFFAVAALYLAARTAQYAGASRTSAGLFVPEGAETVVRVHDLAGKWAGVQKTELWRSFTRRLQKDAAIRKSLNSVLKEAGAPTLDQLEDHRWLDRNPMMSEASILRFAGRDVVFSAVGDKYCVATRVGLGDFLLLPALQFFPGVAGAKRVEAAGARVLKRGAWFVAVQGAILVASNDETLLASALRARGTPEKPASLVHASFKPEPLIPTLKGFPLGALFAVANLEECRGFELDVEVSGHDLVVRMKGEGLKPLRPETAAVDTAGMIPATGIGACVTNVEAAPYWEWLKAVTSRRQRSAAEATRFVQDLVGQSVDVLQANRFDADVLPRLDGPVGVLFGASEGDDGRTYAAVALHLRTSQPREVFEALHRVVQGAMPKQYAPTDSEAGGVSFRSYRVTGEDPMKVNNYLTVSYGLTGDSVILSNNRAFLEDILQCRVQQERPMAAELHYRNAMIRLRDLGMTGVMAPGAASSLFLYGPVIRQGFEGYYRVIASALVDNTRTRPRLRQELEANAAREGQSLQGQDIGKLFVEFVEEKITAKETELRGKARILDYLKWVAFQAQQSGNGMTFTLAIEVN
jgi:hypothetical protein